MTDKHIQHHNVVSLTWVMRDMQGELIDTLDEPVEFLVGGDDLLQAIDDALLQHRVGDEVMLKLQPEQAFGEYDENKIFLEPRQYFPQEIEEGMAISGTAMPEGCSSHIPPDALYIITDVYPEHIVLDGNHPLAGFGLQLQLTIHAARAATLEEIERNSAGGSFFQLEVEDTSQPANPTLH